MVPKVAKSGASFKGAALYYLHDKQANTNERVAFTETVNLPTNDPDRAVAHMIDTAAHADDLKREAGLKAGRKLQKPVYAYSLAWHPTEAPTMVEQIAAAKQTLAVLGLSDRQALIVSHTDREHPHVHVIVNRVCPQTGRAAVTSKDRLKLSQWAEAYEKVHGPGVLRYPC
ncbi:NikB-like protein [Sulfitobacter sp. NAS-14.1]|uniref:relaxase/mobilization nuclease domain-containing protein n=1 Tax=Sulfitobacter sp. (strain NAS-14.1) TaxID=314267 RepID=UPI0000668C9F|nr:relaxase/mobilization nuclease domain-containing protein [Sulfitobacter sp. NAS-14.1]EAP78471.1 NikB-like protein [Sulfitobacter sp. NAS-14.1]